MKTPTIELLSDVEKEKVMTFVRDEILVSAVKKILLQSIYGNGTLRADVDPDPTRNAALGLAALAIGGKGVVSNADLGEDLRGLMQGISLMEQGFTYMEGLKVDKKPIEEEKTNPAI